MKISQPIKQTFKKFQAAPKPFLFILAFATIGVAVLLATKAATPFVSIELGGNSVTPPVTVISDQNASGGSAVQFGSGTVTPPPSGSSRCPAYPAFPEANCTGVPPGVTLRTCDGNLNSVNAVLDGCQFNGDVNVNVTGVTIKNSKILGSVNGNYQNRNLTMIDVEIDGRNSPFDATNAMAGYTCIRCNVHDASKGFTGNNFTVEDSYVHDIYGAGDSHNEAILGSQGNIIIRHSRLDSNFSSSSQGGGMSAVIALYTHGDCSGWCWGPMNNVLIEKNRLFTTQAVYCAYGGDSAEQNPTNVRYIDNIFVKNTNGTCGMGGPITGWLRGGGNIWQNNKFDDGQIIPEPGN